MLDFRHPTAVHLLHEVDKALVLTPIWCILGLLANLPEASLFFEGAPDDITKLGRDSRSTHKVTTSDLQCLGNIWLRMYPSLAFDTE